MLMPRYFFDVFDENVSFDETGLELADVSAAREEAFVRARRMARNGDDAEALTHYVEVTDEEHRWVFGVTIREALRASDGGNPASPLSLAA
jgi:hypothetical protein